ncbi:MAG: hypothetical protein HFJ43_00565 [Clostridia bacterium]|nr:hypothetical protein [Clostridia bacterium]
MKYLIWMVCWVISQRIMMAMGVIYEKPLTSSIFSAVISTIIVLLVRESKIIISIASIMIVLWVILCFENGNVINGLVGGAMNAWLIRIALKKKTGA